ncbi:MAG: LysE family transporter [Candidatus Aminicenantes bacterium]|nr:LysE family transporter [Candidatus Aminicenantes bacterium]
MIINLIAGILTGFIVSIPPMGPIAFAMISKGFKNEIKEGRAIAFGAAFMDFFYCLIAFSGITLIISIFPSRAADFYAENVHLIEMVLTFAGCAVVIISGQKIMKLKITYNKLEAEKSAKFDSAFAKANKLREKAENAAKHLNIPEIKKSNLIGLFFMGVFLCISSVTLPASWIAIIGYLKGYNFLNSSFLGGLLFSSGASAGTLTWSYTLLKLITGHKKRINETTVNKLNIIAGVILLMIGVFLFVKAAVSVFSIM